MKAYLGFLLPLFLTLAVAQCPVGCRYCSADNCTECKDWYHLDTVNNLCKVGEVVDSYVTSGAAPVFEGVVNGHPRHRIPVKNTMVYDPAGLISDMLFIKNRNNAAIKPIFGVNHWYWNKRGDSSVYLWPTLSGGKPIDYSSIFTPATSAPIDILDVREVPHNKFIAKYNSTGAPVFEGVVNGYPRVKIPVNMIGGAKGIDGAIKLDFFIFNRLTGDSWPIFGVNRWKHTDGALYFWAAETAAGVNTAALNALLPAGSTFWIMQMKDQCGTGCIKCTTATTCVKCVDGLFVDKNGACRVGKVIDSYITTRAPVYEGVVNGYPRHRVQVNRNYPDPRTVHNPRGMTGNQLYLRNRNSGVMKKIWGINHFWWSPDSSLYVWPVKSRAVGDWSQIYTPTTAAPVDIVDFTSLHAQKKRAQYQATGAITYQGIQNGFPRFRVPVKRLYANSFLNDATVSSTMYLFNQDTGLSEVIHGVNHWLLGSDNSFYFWPAKSEAGLVQSRYTNLIKSGTTFWVVQYGDICPVVGCNECSSDKICVECADNYYLDTKNNLCKIGVTLRRYNAVAAPVNEGVVNGYLRYKVQVSPTKPHAVHGLISDMAYIRNRVNAKTKKIYGVDHYFWQPTSSLYTWFADTVAGIDPSGSWASIYPSVGTTVEIYDVAALDPARFRAKYLSTGSISYEGVVNKFPRFKVPIKLLEGDLASFKDSQTKLDFFIFNEDTGDSRPIFGINHWYWSKTHFYFWPSSTTLRLSQRDWANLLRSGTTFWVLQMKDVNCGDGEREGLEECDDGNKVNGDGCDTTCTTEKGWTCPTPGKPCVGICGDNILVKVEKCEDGNTRNNDGCSSACTIEVGWTCTVGKTCVPICGDGLLRGTEACDDNNTKSGDGCSSDCDTVEASFSCPTPGLPCKPAAIVCGNKKLESDERCDDGNNRAGDGCSSSCLIEAGWVCPTLGAPCTPLCGDARRVGTEPCDDGNLVNGDGCSSKCVVEAGWKCGSAGTPCTTICGDGIKTKLETCDDGNVKNFDGCTSKCTTEVGWACSTPGKPSKCGDKILAGAERCDDGNGVSGDGCSSTCIREKGWFCPTVGLPCTTVCGDAMRVGKEACDDGNILSGDGCSSQCVVEEGYKCDAATIGAKSVCSAICGDLKIRGEEICDDGNTESGDGCSPECEEEEGFECFTDFPGKCCKLIPMLDGFGCNNGAWVPTSGQTTVDLTEQTELEGIELSICGYVSISTTLTLRNTNLHISGSLSIGEGAELRLLDSSVTISRHCLAATEPADYVRFSMHTGANVTVEGMDWQNTEDEEYNKYAIPRITVDGCGEVGNGNFYLEAENIPSGSNRLPFLQAKCLQWAIEDDDRVFEELWHEIPGSCSGLDTETDEDGNVNVIINMKHLCPGAIAGIVIGSLVGGVVLLGAVAMALGGGGLMAGGSTEDYMAL